MTSSECLYSAKDGMVSLGPEGIALRRWLETRLSELEKVCSPTQRSYPPMLPVKDLARFDYFHNFPHIALCAAPVSLDAIQGSYGGKPHGQLEIIRHEDLADSEYVLPSAACYPVFFDLQGATIETTLHTGVMAQCFRNEPRYEGLIRLRAFSMKEIVCVGTLESAQAHLILFRNEISQLLQSLGIPFSIRPAVDSFYDKASSRAVMQRLVPVKEEFLYEDQLAISSLNLHRNFFGERCGIKLPGGQPAFSSCVGFGIERWMHTLLSHFGGDLQRIERALAG
jgi:seryl-tRNA synthetase